MRIEPVGFASRVLYDGHHHVVMFIYIAGSAFEADYDRMLSTRTVPNRRVPYYTQTASHIESTAAVGKKKDAAWRKKGAPFRRQ